MINANYIQNEQIIPDGISSSFDLANNYKAGTLIVIQNGVINYDIRESTGSNTEIVFLTKPEIGDEIFVSYYKINQPSTLNAIRYITTKQVVSLTSNDLSTQSDAVIHNLINEAQKFIDALVGYHPKYYESKTTQSGQLLTFPRSKDDPDLFNAPSVCYPFIPAEITTATLYSVENIFLAGAQTEADDGAGPVISKKLGDFSYSKAAPANIGGNKQAIVNVIGNKAFAMLSGFIKKSGTLSEGRDGTGLPLNSRQLFVQNNPYL